MERAYAEELPQANKRELERDVALNLGPGVRGAPSAPLRKPSSGGSVGWGGGSSVEITFVWMHAIP